MIKTHLLKMAHKQHAAIVAEIEAFSVQFQKFETVFRAIRAAGVPVSDDELSLQSDSQGHYLQWLPTQTHGQFATVNRVLLENDFRVQEVPGVVSHHSQSWYSYDIDDLRLQVWSPMRRVACVGCDKTDDPDQRAPAQWAQWRKYDSCGICLSCAQDTKICLPPLNTHFTWPPTPDQSAAMEIQTADAGA